MSLTVKKALHLAAIRKRLLILHDAQSKALAALPVDLLAELDRVLERAADALAASPRSESVSASPESRGP